jgi:hypothetical protein
MLRGFGVGRSSFETVVLYDVGQANRIVVTLALRVAGEQRFLQRPPSSYPGRGTGVALTLQKISGVREIHLAILGRSTDISQSCVECVC